MVQRQRRNAQSLKFKSYKGFDGMAEIQQARMLKQIIAALFIRGAVYRNRFAHAPAQREQALNVIHMIMGEQKLLKAAGGPLGHQVR